MLTPEGSFMIHALRREGLSVSAIARRTGWDRKTVRRYLRQGLEAPCYGPRAPRPRILDRYREYVEVRLKAIPELTAVRLLRELRERGYEGGYTVVKDLVREVRPPVVTGFEHRFETPAGQQAQVDFARFEVVFTDDPAHLRIVWLFSLVLGYSRWLFGRFVLHQNLEAFLRCHVEALMAMGGAPREVLYDRMRVAVLGEDEAGQVRFHPALLEVARHFGFQPRACAPYRAKTKGKVERPYRYVRQDFFLGRAFRNEADLNGQFDAWVTTVANPRRHGTTGRIVTEAFEEEKPQLLSMPAVPYQRVLSVRRSLSRDGLVSVDANRYSVPDTTRNRVVEVQSLLDEIRIYDAGRLVAVHEPLPGRGQVRVAPGHRRFPPPGNARRRREEPRVELPAPGEIAAERSLDIYESVGQELARVGGAS